ncbi:helix-turn-helix domain-containing protein [Diplocloster agilis]|uniref:Helix-turn-helix domain-containing protein n=1 Tax=Diplocloster agilis TaxID=2850323 RepID=A0A949K038_9FIRM|nr:MULTISPECIES: helix-turn-helix transcriptional regulator [Lachnospiraceae]MBU9736330.1 helix-turn-helix domain-containing protein [Diplocloster agilis]MBU9746000.1 helix-turn-helix domain-containing protein [Diplocloster agilis]MCU6736368.1 helix-turn-helix domain-containing protein [Suonthocola fibrivorans]SCJ89663.1 HTH-type transcriptional regulator immR [uncultured Clostridium sp.]
MDYQALGKRIREERLKLHLTQEKLAEDIGVSNTYIGLIERGERSLSLDTLVRLANRLGITIDYLLQDSVDPKNDVYENIWRQLFNNASPDQQEMIINVVKLLLNYTSQPH